MGVWKGAATNGGNALFAEWAQGGHTLTITGAKVGSGYVPDINMRSATDLQAEEDDAAIVNAEALTNGTKFRIRVTPAATTGYVAHEIGIWAKVDNGTPVMVSLNQDSDTGIPVPTAAESPQFVFDLYCVLAISNDGTLTVTISTSVYVSNGQFVEEQKRMRLLAEDMPECTATPTFDANGNITTLTHVYTANGLTARTDEYTRTSTTVTEVRTLDSGETLTITTNLNTKAQTLAFG